MDTKCSADLNSKNMNISAGNPTHDKVFLLSIKEVLEYFDSNSSRGCKPTTYAISDRGYIDGKTGQCCWWLRSPGFVNFYAAIVLSGGSVDYSGYDAVDDSNFVRPALWINLNS